MHEDTEGVLFYKQPVLFTCSICGSKDDMNGYDDNSQIPKLMKEQHICYHCAYWKDIITHPPLHMEIIGGIAYVANPFVHRPWHVIKAHFGKEFYIRRYNRSVVRINNLWTIGKVPDNFRKYLPDTANFLSLMTYQKLSKDNHQCYAKGCWDRYHCLRYNKQIEKDGPFNTVPASYHIGDEQCPSFINITELKI